MSRISASIKSLMQIKDVTVEDAKRIRAIWQDTKTRNRKKSRHDIDLALRTFDVEFLGQHKRSGKWVYYCNAGDAYATTILFAGDRMFVGCWGDLVEKGLIHDPQTL